MSGGRDPRPHFVYELWSATTCFYIGMTRTPERRLRDHERAQAFWPLVTDVQVTEYADAFSALSAESARIYMERPANNIEWNPDHNALLSTRPRFARLERYLAGRSSLRAASP